MAVTKKVNIVWWGDMEQKHFNIKKKAQSIHIIIILYNVFKRYYLMKLHEISECRSLKSNLVIWFFTLTEIQSYIIIERSKGYCQGLLSKSIVSTHDVLEVIYFHFLQSFSGVQLLPYVKLCARTLECKWNA